VVVVSIEAVLAEDITAGGSEVEDSETVGVAISEAEAGASAAVERQEIGKIK
jgi:hypothetical protein